ncbi:MAG: hypothetical protein WAV54_13305 [Acidimicrobiales bacterium]
MGSEELRRFELDQDTSGLWDQVKGDLKRRQGRVTNGKALRIVARLYLELARRDKAELGRMMDRLRLEDEGFDAR